MASGKTDHSPGCNHRAANVGLSAPSPPVIATGQQLQQLRLARRVRCARASGVAHQRSATSFPVSESVKRSGSLASFFRAVFPPSCATSCGQRQAYTHRHPWRTGLTCLQGAPLEGGNSGQRALQRLLFLRGRVSTPHFQGAFIRGSALLHAVAKGIYEGSLGGVRTSGRIGLR